MLFWKYRIEFLNWNDQELMNNACEKFCAFDHQYTENLALLHKYL